MSQWDSYPNSVVQCSKEGQCVGAGIYGSDNGNPYAVSSEMPQFPPADVKKAVDYIKNQSYNSDSSGLVLGNMKFTFLRVIQDGSDTVLVKRKPRDENEELKDQEKYQCFIQLAKTTVMIALFKGGAQGNHVEGVKRMNDLVEYLKSQNM